MVTPGFAETTALIAVLEQKSFTKAATQLGLSPARVSEMVRNLEERLNVRLVERTTRSVAATSAGERLLGRLRPVLDAYEAAFDSLNDFRDKPAGMLRLTVAPLAADLILAPLVARFAARYPDITLDISVNRDFVDVVEGRFDAGIRPDERVERDMIAVRVSDDIPFVVAASPEYLERHGTPKAPQDLTNHACIRFRLPSGALVPWRFSVKQQAYEVAVEGPLIASEPGVGIRAAIDGAGLIQIQAPYLAEELAAGRLLVVLADWGQPRVGGFCLYYSSRRQMRPPLKALVDFLREESRVKSTAAT